MAYLIPGTNPPIYNVEQAVGQNSPNARGDVMLVQYLLHHLYGNAAPDLKVDGWIGPITLRWIKQFQIDLKQHGYSIVADGRVDRAGATKSSVSKTFYTILWMQKLLFEKNPAAYALLPKYVPLSTKPKPSPYSDAGLVIPASGGF